MRRCYNSTRLFGEVHWNRFVESRLDRIRNEIQKLTKKYILNISEDEYVAHMVDKYKLEPIEILKDTERFEEPIKEKQRKNAYGREFLVEVYKFEIQYNYVGSSDLFPVLPSRYTMRSIEVLIDRDNSVVKIPLEIAKRDPELFNKQKKENYNLAISHLPQINHDIVGWNNRFPSNVTQWYQEKRKEFTDENKFYEAINLKVKSNAENIFVPNTVRKKIIPQPKIDPSRTFKSSPTLHEEIYNDILSILHSAGSSMENKPTLYLGKGEEELRDQFLFLLESRYEGTTATGETFNKGGKTDILLRHFNEGNLFVAECKFWRGEKSLLATINQLFDRYLTWRDSKVAILIFVDNKGISDILESTDSIISKHDYFHRVIGQVSESRFKYEMRLPDDSSKVVHLEIQFFHYPK